MKARIGKYLTRNVLPNPIFVAGIGRSGTSVLLKALVQHPLVLPSWGEAPLIRSFGELAGYLEYSEHRDYYRESLNVPEDYFLAQLRRLCFEYVVGANYGLGRHAEYILGRGQAARQRDGLGPFIKGILDRVPSTFGKRHWCAKMLPRVNEYHGLLRLYPGAKVVYIVRNGLDVVHSRTRFHGFRNLPFESHCYTWTESVEDYRHLVDAEASMLVRHDRLVADPEGFLGEVYDFTGLTYERGPIDFVKNTMMIPLDEETKDGIDVKKAFEARRPPYENWTPEQKEAFKRIAGNAMDEMGYEIPF